MREINRSRSWIDFSVSRALPRSVVFTASSSTASRRSRIGSSAVSGRSSQVRSSRLPIGVTVRSISSSSDPAAAAVHRLHDLEMLERRRIDLQAVGQLAKPDAAHVRELRLLRIAQVAHERAAGADRGLAPLEPKAFEALHAQLIEQRLTRRLELEVPAVDLGDGRANLRDLRDRRRDVVPRGDYDLSRPEHGDLGSQRRESLGPRIFSDVEFAGREIHQRDAVIARPGTRGWRSRQSPSGTPVPWRPGRRRRSTCPATPREPRRA